MGSLAEAVPGEKRGPFISPWAMGWFFLYCHFRECVFPPASWLARKVTAGSGCHKCRIVHSLWLGNWAGDQAGPQTQVFPFHFKSSQLQGLKNRFMVTLGVMARGVKVNAIDRPSVFRIISQFWNNCRVIARVIQRGGEMEWLWLARLYVEIIWNNKKNFLGKF